MSDSWCCPVVALDAKALDTWKGRSPYTERGKDSGNLRSEFVRGLLPYDEGVGHHVPKTLVLARCHHRHKSHQVEEQPVYDARHRPYPSMDTMASSMRAASGQVESLADHPLCLIGW